MKEMKKKVFAILLAFALVFTLMPLAAFAENTGGSGDSIEGDGNQPPPEIDPATGITFTVFKHTYETVGNESIIIPLKGAAFTLTNVESGTVYGPATSDEEGYAAFSSIQDGTYELREIKAPEGYWRNPLPEIYEVKDKKIYIVYSEEFKPECEDNIVRYENSKPKQKIVNIKLDKKVEIAGTEPADENKQFKARLSFVNFESNIPVVLESYDTYFKAGDEFLKFKILINCLKQSGDVGVYLQEVPDTDSSWQYDSKMYQALYRGTSAISLDNEDDEIIEEDTIEALWEVDSNYRPIEAEPGVEPQPTDVATFTNIYTSNNGGGGGSHAKYYDIKVNGGKALNILGNEVTRASSGSVIDVQADAPAEGKVFKGWEVVQGRINAGETSEFSFIMPRTDVELTAVYEDTAVEEPVIEEPKDPAEPEQPDEDVEEQPEEKDETPVPKTGDAMTMELLLFAVLAAGAAFGMKKSYNKTK